MICLPGNNVELGEKLLNKLLGNVLYLSMQWLFQEPCGVFTQFILDISLQIKSKSFLFSGWIVIENFKINLLNSYVNP